jgi:hypothetical protein
MRKLLYLLPVALAIVAFSSCAGHAQTKVENGAVLLTNSKCLQMCRERGYAASQGKSCQQLCRPGCRNAATGERFCVK